MANEEEFATATEILTKAKNVVVFTGAGISAESGIPTFRGKDGLWQNYGAEELLPKLWRMAIDQDNY